MNPYNSNLPSPNLPYNPIIQGGNNPYAPIGRGAPNNQGLPFNKNLNGSVGLQRNIVDIHRAANNSPNKIPNFSATYQIMKWGYVSDDGPITEYEPAVCRLIEEAFQNKEPGILITCSNQRRYSIYFSIMLQKSEQGVGGLRTVRRLDGSSMLGFQPGDIVWYWQDKDDYKQFTSEACRQIEYCYQTNQSPIIVQGNGLVGYFINLHQMIQMNRKTLTRRNIMRQN